MFLIYLFLPRGLVDVSVSWTLDQRGTDVDDEGQCCVQGPSLDHILLSSQPKSFSY